MRLLWVGNEILPAMTTLTSPHDLLAAIPFLIGYHPTNSLVMVSLKEESVGMAMRVDYPECQIDDPRFQDQIDLLVHHLVRDGGDGALILAYVPDTRGDGEEILNAMATAIFRAQIEVRESLLIWQGRWRSILCADTDCCPPQGRQLPELATSNFAVEQVVQGRQMPFNTVEEMSDSIASLPLARDAQFIAQVNLNRVDENSPNIRGLQRDGALCIIDLVSRFIAGSMGTDITADQELSARVVGRLSDIQIRDFALGAHDEVTRDIYAMMWRYLIRIAPVGFVAPIACLLAVLSYERGEGALANRALERATHDDPSYSLTTLLGRVFSAGWPPESFSAMRKELHPKVCATIFDH